MCKKAVGEGGRGPLTCVLPELHRFKASFYGELMGVVTFGHVTKIAKIGQTVSSEQASKEVKHRVLSCCIYAGGLSHKRNVRWSVCPSVCQTRELWRNGKKTNARIRKPHERTIHLVF